MLLCLPENIAGDQPISRFFVPVNRCLFGPMKKNSTWLANYYRAGVDRFHR